VFETQLLFHACNLLGAADRHAPSLEQPDSISVIFHQRFANYQDNEAWLAYQAQLLLPGSTKCADRGLIFEAWLLFQVLLVF